MKWRADAEMGDRGRRIVLRRQDDRLILDSLSVTVIKSNGLTVANVNTAWQYAPDLCRRNHGPFQFSIQFDRMVGLTRVIPVSRITPDQTALFAYHTPSRISRVVCAEAYTPSSEIALAGERVGKRTWVLRTAYYGPAILPEPTDEQAFQAKIFPRATLIDFWCRHAFIYLPDGTDFISQPQESCWTKVVEGRFPPPNQLVPTRHATADVISVAGIE